MVQLNTTFFAGLLWLWFVFPGVKPQVCSFSGHFQIISKASIFWVLVKHQKCHSLLTENATLGSELLLGGRPEDRLFAHITFFLTQSCFWPFWKGGNPKKNILPHPAGVTVIRYWAFRERWELMAFFHEVNSSGNPDESLWLGCWSFSFSSSHSFRLRVFILGVWLQNRKPTCAGSDGPWPISYSDHMWPMGNIHFSLITGRCALYSAIFSNRILCKPNSVAY